MRGGGEVSRKLVAAERLRRVAVGTVGRGMEGLGSESAIGGWRLAVLPVCMYIVCMPGGLVNEERYKYVYLGNFLLAHDNVFRYRFSFLFFVTTHSKFNCSLLIQYSTYCTPIYLLTSLLRSPGASTRVRRLVWRLGILLGRSA